ncbi:MAG TPA: hypothetical protein DDY59_07695 [Lachnospiraceae bacterium]|jgi:hypothetical protein|nr:hypothetical protein [Lachnospiraceae bacterium]HCM12014.1 hypothetical protein [Lachnospiraceae bacterium]
MDMKQSEEASKELSYIKTIMTKSQFSYRYGTKFFVIVACYLLIVNLTRKLLITLTLNMNSFLELYNVKLAEQLLMIIAVFPLLLIIFLFHRIAKRNSTDMSLWLYEICAFSIIVCTVMPPIILLPNITDNVIADIFSVAGVSICMFICGQFLQCKKMKVTAIVYFIIICIVLFIFGFLFVIVQTGSQDISDVKKSVLLMYSYGTSIINMCYSPLGYLLLGIEIYQTNKRSRNNVQ